MDRQEKKKIRMQIIDILDEKCGKCVYLKGNHSPEICRYSCMFGQKMQALQAKMETKPVSSRKKQVKTYTKGRYTLEEEFYLIHHMELYTITHLANRLNRTLSSVSLKVKQLRQKKNRRFNQGKGYV